MFALKSYLFLPQTFIEHKLYLGMTLGSKVEEGDTWIKFSALQGLKVWYKNFQTSVGTLQGVQSELGQGSRRKLV